MYSIDPYIVRPHLNCYQKLTAAAEAGPQKPAG